MNVQGFFIICKRFIAFFVNFFVNDCVFAVMILLPMLCIVQPNIVLAEDRKTEIDAMVSASVNAEDTKDYAGAPEESEDGNYSDESEIVNDEKIDEQPSVIPAQPNLKISHINDGVPSFVMIDKISSQTQHIAIKPYETIAFGTNGELSLFLEWCSFDPGTAFSNAKVRIVDTKEDKELFSGELFAPQSGKNIWVNKKYVLNLLSCH
jgi:hypothetical protein